MKIDLFGPYPYPTGGVSVHIYRLANYLSGARFQIRILDNAKINEKIGEPDFHILSIRGLRFRLGWKRNWFGFLTILDLFQAIYLLLCSPAEIVHFHTPGNNFYWREWLYVATVERLAGKRAIVTLHGSDAVQRIQQAPWPMNRFALAWLRRCSGLIVLNPDQFDLVRNVANLSEEKIAYIPSHISPHQTGKKTGRIHPKKFAFMAVGNWEPRFGLELAVAALGMLRDKGRDAELKIFIYGANPPDAAYKKSTLELIEKLCLQDAIQICGQVSPDELETIYLKTDIHIRPTYTDSFGLSLSESIHFGVPAVGSDVCKRADGVVAFPTGDAEALAEVVEDIMNHYEAHLQRVAKISLPDYRPDITAFYERILGGKN